MAMVGVGEGHNTRLTVAQACAQYAAYKQAAGQPVYDTLKRSAVHILPALGDLVVDAAPSAVAGEHHREPVARLLRRQLDERKIADIDARGALCVGRSGDQQHK